MPSVSTLSIVKWCCKILLATDEPTDLYFFTDTLPKISEL